MTPDPRDQAFLAQTFGTAGHAAAMLADVDWRSHRLGPPDEWPRSLIAALRNMLASPEAMCILWGKEPAFFFNDPYIPFLGDRLAHATGARYAALWPELYERMKPSFSAALKGRATRIFDDHVNRMIDGEVVDSCWSYSFGPMFDDDGAIAGVQCVTNETTDHILRATAEQRATAALATSERRLRRAQEAGHIGIFAIEISTNELVGTPEFFRMFGLAEKPVINATVIEDMVIPDDHAIISRAASRKAETIDMHVEYRIRRPDNGELRWIERRGEFERDDDGRPIRLVGIVQDVTERQAARAALDELNATLETRVRERTAERNLLATIVEETDNFFYVVDRDYRWLAVNRAGADEFERIFGRQPRIGERIHDSLRDHPKELAEIEAVWARAMAGEETTIIWQSGTPSLAAERQTYEVKFNTLRDEDGNCIGAFEIVTNITERINAEAAYRQMQETLRQSQKMEAMGQLTGGVAHDFNNLLTPIIGSLDLIQRRSVLTEREARLIDGALQSAERAKTLVQRLLAFARRQPLQPGPVEMAKLIGGMAELLSSTSGPLIRIRTDVPDTLPPALADHNQLEMAVLNLCVNARDAMPDGGRITIAARAETVRAGSGESLAPGDYVQLSVSDTGTGMDEETLRRAIEPFYSTKGIGKGTGLGLSMVDGLTSQLGGTMKLSSRLGLGTRVDLWLPVSDAAASEPRGMVEEAAEKRFRGRALVVDDEALVRITTADMLQGLGYETEEAESARDAQRLLRSGRRFDLVVTDHLMPGMSGAELAMAIRRHWPGLPVLIVSGYADAETIAPDMPRLSKPFREIDLGTAIAELG